MTTHPDPTPDAASPEQNAEPWFRVDFPSETTAHVVGVCIDCRKPYEWTCPAELSWPTGEGGMEPIYPEEYCQRCRIAWGYY